MKKVLSLLIAVVVTTTVSAQDLKSLSSSAKSSVTSSLIDGLAGNQVKKFAKKLNLNESQQEQVSSLVVNQLKSEKFQKMLGSFGTTNISEVTPEQKQEVTKALLSDPEFKGGMSKILDDGQKKMFSSIESPTEK